jgi:hypothetical protein
MIRGRESWIAPTRFAELTRPLVGLPVSHSWRGYGSAIFLELGALRSAGKGRERRGKATVMLQWSWRVESARAIRLGSWSGERRITNGVRSLATRFNASLSESSRWGRRDLARDLAR